MKRSLASLLAVSFILWVLPLGFLIKPSLQKLACDGQRAICMCHAFIPKMSDKAMEAGLVFKSAPAPNKENSSGGSNYFVSVRSVPALNLRPAFFLENYFFCYKNPYLASLEYVPKI